MFDALKNLKDKDALKNLKEKAEEVAGTHGDKISDGLEKVGEFVDGKTRGKLNRRSREKESIEYPGLVSPRARSG